MSDRFKPAIFVVVLALFIAMAAVASTTAEGKMNGTDEVNAAIAAANHEFTKNGFMLDDYEIEVDEQMSQGNYWMIWYERKGKFKLPGGKHGVQVDKSNGRAIFMKGQ